MNNRLFSTSGMQDPEWQWNEYKERERIIKMLNKGDIVEPQETRPCECGNHYILINEFGLPQCSACLMHFTWRSVRENLKASGLPDTQLEERMSELRHVSKLVIDGKPPNNVVNWNDYRYSPEKGHVYVERYFYERE